MKLTKKLKSNLHIYKQDLRAKGVYWSIVHRLYKVVGVRKLLSPLVDVMKPEYVMVQGRKLYIDKRDTIVSEMLVSQKVWEPYETGVFIKQIKSGDVVVDIGAHIGYYTLLAASLVGATGKVYAFEPDPANFKLLEKNVSVNGFNNVVLVNKAVSDTDGVVVLYLNDENKGDHRIYDTGDSRRTLQIEAVRLDNFFKRGSKVEFIKMDIQGAEYKAIKGAQRVLEDNKGIKIISEYMPEMIAKSGDSPKGYLELLKKKHFKFYQLDEVKEKQVLINPEKLLDTYRLNNHYLTNLLCFR